MLDGDVVEGFNAAGISCEAPFFDIEGPAKICEQIDQAQKTYAGLRKGIGRGQM